MRLSATTRLAAVIGHPVSHSLSPTIHNAAYAAMGRDWAYAALDVAPGRAREAVEAARVLGLVGLNVTMPHKGDAAAAVDRLTPTARVLGTANTVVPIGGSGGELLGDNTDAPGFLDALRVDEGFDPQGRRCLVVGAGGAARAVVHALAGAGAADVVVVGRDPERAGECAALAPGVGRVGERWQAADAELVVNATPLGMAGRPGDELPVDPADLGPGQVVFDLVYDPVVTPLLRSARARGAMAANGLGMLIHQAAHAIRLWTGESPPLEVMSAAAVAELGRREADGTTR